MVSSPPRGRPAPRGGRMSEALLRGFCLRLSSPIFPLLDATRGARGVKPTPEARNQPSDSAKPLNELVIRISARASRNWHGFRCPNRYERGRVVIWVKLRRRCELVNRCRNEASEQSFRSGILEPHSPWACDSRSGRYRSQSSQASLAVRFSVGRAGRHLHLPPGGYDALRAL